LSAIARRATADLPPHFFARISGKKITKTQVFTSRGEAALHSKAAGFSSLPRRNEMKPGHLHQTPEALLVKTLHFIPLVKAFRYRFTCEVAACGGRMCSCLKCTLRCLKYKNWLLLLAKTNYIVPAEYDRLESLCRELRITLISSINTAKGNIK